MSPSVIEQVRDELVSGVARYELRRRRVRAAAISAVLVIVLVAGTLLWNADTAGRRQVLVQPEITTTTATEPVAPPGPLPGLETIPSPPGGARLPLPPVWTGRELLSVGALDDEGTLAAFSFDIEERAWRTLALPPVTISSGSTMAWTGDELVVCCGATPESDGAAAYDPTTDSWRVLPDAPVHGYVTSVWTGSRVVVAAPDGVAAFEPASDRWSLLPAPPELASFNHVVWSGTDLVVWPSPGSRTVHAGNRFDFDTGKWSTLPAPPEQSWPAIPDVVWLDGSLVVLGGLPANGPTSERFVAARYDPSTNTWASLPDPLPEPDGCECNLGSHVSLWSGRDLLVFNHALASGAYPDGVLLAYEPESNTWRVIGKNAETALQPTAMAGDRVLLERDGAYYLSEPRWRPGGGPAPGALQVICPAAVHFWQFIGASPPETADGLPPSGIATLATAERELRERGGAIINKYGAVSARATVGLHGGWAWKRVDGAITVVPEPLGTIDVVLRDQSRCPSAPAFENGIPLTFEIHPG